MKHIAFIVCAFSFFTAKAQVVLTDHEARSVNEIDTIYVNDNTAYLIFNHDVYSFGIGNTEEFLGLAYKNSLQIRANHIINGLSSVFVTYGDSTYKQYKYCILKYAPGVMKEYNDYRDDFYKYRTSEVQKKELKKQMEEEEQSYYIAEIKTRAKNVLNMSDELDMGNTLNNLSLLCRLIRIDKDYAYIKFEFINQSSVDYFFEKVSFQYEEKFRQGFLKKKKLKAIDVWPVITPESLRVNAYENRSIVYVIPIYGLEEKESMVVTFREKQGGRNMEIRLESELINSSKELFKNAKNERTQR
jgi:hypothetical protein